MANGKKSVLLYCDLIHTVKKLTDEQAGKLFKHYLSYINDENPKTNDIIIDLVFEPIKRNLKRDLVKWEGIKEDRSLNGREGNLKRWNKDLYDLYKKGDYTLLHAESIAKGRKASPPDSTLSPPIANIAVNDTVTVNVTDTVKDIYYIQEIEFLNDWGKARLHFNGVKTLFKKLNLEESMNFEKLKNSYTRDEFRTAMQGLFEQKGLYKSTKVRPTHFLRDSNLEKYQDCKINKIKLFDV